MANYTGQSDKELIGVLEYSPFPMWIYDIDSLKFLNVNEEAVSHYGYSKEEFLSMTLEAIRPEEELPKFRAAINSLRKRETSPYDDLFTHKKKDGTLIKVLIRGKKIDYQGKKAEVITAIDKTERFNFNKEISRQKEQLKLLDRINAELMKSSDLRNAIGPLTALLYEAFPVIGASFLEFDGLIESGAVSYTCHLKNGTGEFLRKGNISLSCPRSYLPGVYPFGSKEVEMFKGLWENEDKDKDLMLISILIQEKIIGLLLFLMEPSGIASHSGNSHFISSISSSLSHFAEKWHLYKKLEDSEEKFRALVQEGTDLIAVLDENGTYTYVSPTSSHVLGIHPDGFIGRSPFEFIHPEDREKVSKDLESVFTTKYVKVAPFRFMDGNGNYRWIETTLTNMMANKSIKGIVANSVDVTDFKKQQQEIDMVNERYRLATLASKDHIYDMDMRTGEVVGMGKALETVFGYVDNTNSAYHVDFWKENIHPDDQEKVLWMFEQFIKNRDQHHLSLNYRLRRADGSFAIVVDYCSAIRDNEGKVMRIVGIVRDITKAIQKDRMENLKFRMSSAIGQPGKLTTALKKGLRELLNFTGLDRCEIWIRSKDGKYLDLNAAVYRNPKHKMANHFSKAKKDEGFPGTIWKTMKPVVWDNLDSHLAFKRGKEAISAKLEKGIGVPILHENEFIGAFILFSSKEGVTLHEWKDFLFEIGKQIGGAIKYKIFETEMETFFNISSNLFAIVGFDGEIKKVNAAFSSLFSNSNLIGRKFNSLVYDEDKERIDSFLKPKEPLSVIESKCKVNKGGSIWVSWKKNIRSEEKLLFVMGQDISERKKSEMALQEAFKKLSQAQSIAKLGYWSRNIDENISEWTAETYKIYGYRKDDFIPTYENLLRTFHPDDRYMMEELTFEELAAQSPKKYTHRVITAKGELRWVTQTVNVLTDQANKPYRIEGVIQDITEQKEIEEKLKTSNDRFNMAMMATKEMIWDVDHELGLVYRSKAFMDKVDYMEMDKLGLNDSWLSNIVEAEREEVWRSFMLVCGDKNQHYWQKEYSVKTKEGNNMYVFDRCYIMRDGQGMPNRSVGAIEDISEMKKQMELVQLQNDKLKEIAWKQSHEVRAPLARIMSLVNYLELVKDNRENIYETLGYIMQSANELDEVIKEITQDTN
ncbi:PAS domain S-box protein [Echinicola shivajiensis]|uniref:PAS domain S-box protein n=1 Tax=Echinicola shivajiensis TaxID=1035916 RepID=UPI001BFCCA5C|nr:PAS domain S-box protein [Echinicola shivajiensis]